MEQLDFTSVGFQGQSSWPTRQYDWKEENILQATKVWFRHINMGGKPIGAEWYNVSDLYKNYPKSFWSGGAFGSSATSRGWAGILITINNTNPDYYSVNNIGYISHSSNADLEAGLYRIWAKHPYNNSTVISISFSKASDYERWREYIW
ncbi:MAG: hypothetical protein CVU09_01545 [Bacteroidetes bacterium HGW-Bacteroidetes-4]|jgi:hypothetical protein|nr:MAG: hypothetical protein CVU09_01545 [Bacteroidetes bacterium HGW-Bacteroidetes-4]